MGHNRIDVDDAVRLINEHMPAFGIEPVPVNHAHGRILQQTIYAERDQPPFDRVTMDGIAIRYRDFDAGQNKFTVTGTQGAGAPGLTLGNDAACVEIMTGAMLPAGADTIIPVERIERTDNQAVIQPDYRPQQGQFIHRQGSDYLAGAALLAPGVDIGPTESAVLTIGGSANVQVSRQPSIAVISTGDELVETGQPITPFQIRSSNGLAIVAALNNRGMTNTIEAGLPDNPDTLRAEISRLHAASDVMILSGGVSMGKYDYVPQILDELGVAVVFHKVLQRPGLPMWFGVSKTGTPVFALPGNPVSSLVCAVRYVIPALRMAMCATPKDATHVRLSEAVDFVPDLAWFLPVALEMLPGAVTGAIPRPTNTSGDFVSLTHSDGFIELPRGNDHFAAGEIARFFCW